jgi:hypothetical protein
VKAFAERRKPVFKGYWIFVVFFDLGKQPLVLLVCAQGYNFF